MPRGGFSVSIETREVQNMLSELLRKMENPTPFISEVIRYVKAVTYKMFHGVRPDTAGVRGVRWPRLAKTTIAAKLARGISKAHRPLWATGEMWASVKVLYKAKDGFIYGTRLRSTRGFPYPAIHNVGGWVAGRPPQREWLFLNQDDQQTILRMAIEYLETKRALI